MALVAFWIEPGLPTGPLGLGVTAETLQEALGLAAAAGYGEFLPADTTALRVKENVTFDELPRHVREHTGPMVVRGVWYPWPTPGWFGQSKR